MAKKNNKRKQKNNGTWILKTMTIAIAVAFFAVYIATDRDIRKATMICSGFVLIMCVFALLIHKIVTVIEDKKYWNKGINKIDNMTGEQFEEYLTTQFRKRGYRAQHVGQTGDFGVDVIITDKNGKRTAVQAKRYKANIGSHAIQEVYAGAKYHNCSNRIVVTNSHFTKNAKELAQKTDVELWDREKIIKEFNIK